jgi:Ca2+-binding EF-hand superfamily protein
LATLLAAPVLLAQPGPLSADHSPRLSMLERLDQDGDGLISLEEFNAGDRVPGMRMLDRADADGDGAVTREELQASIDLAAEERRERIEQHMEQRFDALDEDGDGMIMRTELLEQAFSSLDANGDGFISEAEAQQARDRRRHRRGRRGDGPADAFDGRSESF